MENFALKKFHVINFCGFNHPQKIFNNELFPDYGICKFKEGVGLQEGNK